MAYFKEKQAELIQKIGERAELNEKLRELNRERYPLNNKVIKLEIALQNAVNQENEINKGGISSIFHKMSGKLESKREDAHREVIKARCEYDDAARRLNDLDDGIARIQEELKRIYDCENKLKQLKIDKLSAIKDSKHPEKLRVINLEADVVRLEKCIAATREAIITGDDVRSTVSQIIRYSDTSGDISVSDILFKSTISLIETAANSHDKYKHAQSLKGTAITKLEKLIMKLTEITDFAGEYTDIGYLERFFEIVNKNKADMKHILWDKLLYQIEIVLKKLDSLIEIMDNKYKAMKDTLDALVDEIDI